MRNLCLAGIAAAAMLPASIWLSPGVQAQTLYTVDNTPEPATIRVAIRENNPSGEPDPRGRIVWVQTVPFYQYCEDVLPNEWMPSWDPESLKAGAMAIKMFAWYHHLHPVTIEGKTFDVDNTTNFQSFRYWSRQPDTNQAVAAVNKFAYVKNDGEIFELNYRAGIEDNPNWQYRNAQKMSQWGSEYWAIQGRSYVQILQFYYADRALRQYR